MTPTYTALKNGTPPPAGHSPQLDLGLHLGLSEAVAARKAQAAEAFGRLGFPTQRHEDWRYINLAPWLGSGWASVPAPQTVPGNLAEQLQARYISPDYGHRLVFVNGLLAPGLGSQKQVRGLLADELSTALASAHPLAEQHFARHLKTDFNGLVALNTATATQGAFVAIGKGVAIEEPLYVVAAHDAAHGSSHMQMRNLIVAQEGSSATIVLHHVSNGDARYFLNAATEIVVEKGANLKVFLVQTPADDAAEVHTVQVHQEGQSNCAVYTFCLGGQLLRNDLNVAFAGQHAETHLYGLYVTKDKQLVDNHSFVDHAVPNCFSNEFFKGIMMDNSTAVFNGKIMVRPQAQKTNAYQSNKNILLSPTATINTKPQLEIFADDVKCSHGATTGQLDEDAVFYLRSRGIPHEQARAMLTFAFAEDVVEYVEDPVLRSYLDHLLEQRIAQVQPQIVHP